jgi:hypothetical protein
MMLRSAEESGALSDISDQSCVPRTGKLAAVALVGMAASSRGSDPLEVLRPRSGEVPRAGGVPAPGRDRNAGRRAGTTIPAEGQPMGSGIPVAGGLGVTTPRRCVRWSAVGVCGQTWLALRRAR